MGAYTAKIGRFRLRYLNYPIINTAFAIVGNYKDALNAGEVNDDFMARLSLLGKAWFQSLALIKDTWLAKGINDIFEMIGGLIASFGGDEQGRKRLKEDGDIIEIDKRVTRQLENARDNYTGLLIKYIDPLKSNNLQQIMKFATPEGRLKGTGLQLWAYNVGLQWWNDKRTDIFGQEVKTLPGDQGTAWPREKDERWEKMWKYNIHIQDISAKEKLVIKGVPQTLEWEQYIERKDLVQDLFKDRFDEYFKKTPQKEIDKKAETYKVDPISGNKTNIVDNDIRKIWSDTRSDVKKYMFVWDDYVEKNKNLMTTLMKEGVLPDFYKPQLEDENGEKIIIPFDKLLELNKNIMNIFLPDAKEYLGSLSEADLKAEKEDKDDNGVSRFEDYLKWYWDRAKDEAVSDLEDKLMKW